MRLKDKVVIVTGGARGIGKAYAVALSKEGAKVVVSDILHDGANSTADEIRKSGGEALAITGDVSKESDANRLAAETFKEFKRIDVLINNAGLYAGLKRRSFFEIDVEEWDKVMAVNVKGTWLCTKEVFPYMREQKSGKIINISSGTFFNGTPMLSHYVASKGAVVGFTRAICRELGQYNITINAVAPGFTITEANTEVMKDQQYITQMIKSRALQRDQYPKDLTGTVLFLCSSESDFMTGQTLVVDGGRSMH
jgi:NAD(P)-dependent dehydrogenase (short-subunit alcohol dehydrogenase family)